MPDGIFSGDQQTGMPGFSVLGLLLGGRGYASGWFQQRDRLAMADAAVAKERADRATFAQGMLADPRWKKYLENPNDRAAAGNLWGLMYGGPESAASMGNSLFTQGVGAIQQQELAALQNKYQLGQQQQAHDFNIAEQQFGTDEALRKQQLLRKDQVTAQLNALDYATQPMPDGMTAEQKQHNLNILGDQAFPEQRKPGYDWAPNLAGQIPQQGTEERRKIERVGNAYSNIADLATKHLWQLENGQVSSVAAWNQEVNWAKDYMRSITEAGAMSGDDQAFYEDVLGQLGNIDKITPDMTGNMKERLRVLKEKAADDLQRYAASTLIPKETYTQDDWQIPENYRPTEPPPQDEFNKGKAARDKRLEELGPRNERRVRPALEYQKKGEGSFIEDTKEFLTRKGRNPRAYSGTK